MFYSNKTSQNTQLFNVNEDQVKSTFYKITQLLFFKRRTNKICKICFYMECSKQNMDGERCREKERNKANLKQRECNTQI